MKNILSKHDLKYVQKIPEISVDKIGNLINQGVHHRVYHYGKNQVIKIPRRRFDFLYSTKSHLESDLELLNQYFPHLIVKTKVVASPDHKQHCIIQEKCLDFEKITPRTILTVWPEYEKLRKINSQLLKNERASLDLLGGEGFISCLSSLFNHQMEPTFSNMVIIRCKIKLLDTELLRFTASSFSWSETLRVLLSINSQLLSEACLKIFFSK